ncbi:hypothetical protein LEL_08999 [Akanthomyces lecanii RCEF 1005]|uniref:Uncharacterized protein n=1 Tax=Akanthomyces lecanii RCEF 1005 TaxID=1081108 RepID=A0A162LK70_CORDF|nr:hypothetical protein LEL_08999 [Akanthomyces lecanii RCEF 1005]
MCITNIYVHVRPDGRRSTSPQVLLCPSSRFGRPCPSHVEVHHPMPAQDALPPSASPVTHFPPTPQYSPRPSSRGSASDADRHSRHSSTSSSRRRQRSPGIYVNGQRVVNVHASAAGAGARHERVMLVPHPPTPRTPPQSFNMPRTAPPSPSANLSIPYGSSPRESYSRPYLVDERRAHVPIHHPSSPATSSRHSRQASTSSQGSRHSAAAAAVEDEERRRRRDEEREQRRVARKAQELRERIEKANAEIASRPTVRVVNQQQKEHKEHKEPRRSRRDGFDEVVGAMGRMTVEDRNWKERRAHERALELEKEEQKAQDQRLRERMVPRRRATVGPGSRRHRVAYDDGLYRWE